MKNRKMLFGIFLVFVLLLSTGLTYAWFSVNITGNNEAKDVRVSTGSLTILYTDGPEIKLLQANPGDTATKTFTVKNNGTLDAYYKINWSAFNNAITKDELSVSFTCKSYSTYISKDNAGNIESGKCTNMTSEAVYNRDLKSNIQISTGITHEYTLTMDFLDIKVNQNYNQGQTFTGTLQVQTDTASWASSCTNNNSLRCKIITETTPVGDDVSSTYVTASTGVNFGAISSPTNGQGLYINNKIGDGDNYYFRGGTFCAYTDYLTEVTAGTKCTTAGGTWTNYTCSYDLSKSACEAAGFTFYEIKNNVSFGGYMWKVIRIDEDGAVRLLYNGTSTTSTGTSAQIGTASYNSKNDDNAYVGYMQPTVTTHTTTKVQAESNDINSPVKTLVDNWYNTNLSTHSSKIDTNAGYCNDRRVDTVDGGIGDTSTTYSARSRITASTKIPTYKCGHESNDLFTYTNGTYGNKKLTYPTGLITSDELAYAGSLYGSYNYQVFTHSGYWYWTQSPSFFSGGLASVGYLRSYSIFGGNNVNGGSGARLVVSLNSTATVGSGEGTLTSPYVIE